MDGATPGGADSQQVSATSALGQVYVNVIPGNDHMLVRVTSMDEGPGVTRMSDRKPDERGASEILRRARELPRQ
jgi:hypothetical protein